MFLFFIAAVACTGRANMNFHFLLREKIFPGSLRSYWLHLRVKKDEEHYILEYSNAEEELALACSTIVYSSRTPSHLHREQTNVFFRTLSHKQECELFKYSLRC